MLRPGSRDVRDRERDELLRRYARSRRPQDLERLVLTYQPLARALARRYASASCAREDLDQTAYEGLVKAIRRFEPDRGTSFESFAVPTILGELRRYLRDSAWPAHLPRSLQERVREVRTMAEDVQARTARAPSARELAVALGCEQEAIVEALGVSSALAVVPLDAPVVQQDESSASVADHVGSEDPGYHRVECLTTLESAIPALSNEQRTVLRLRYGQDLTQRQIAVRLGRSRSEVARDLRDAVGRLRAVAA